MRTAVGNDSGLGKSLKFDLKQDGVIRIDGADVSNDDRPADLTFILSLEDLVALGQSRLEPISAVLSGRLKFSDTFAALAIQPALTSLLRRVPASDD